MKNLLFSVFIAVYALPTWADCVVKRVIAPVNVTGGTTLTSCKSGSKYYDEYRMSDLTAGRRLRFTITKGTLPNLDMSLRYPDFSTFQVVTVIQKTEYSKATLSFDVEIPKTLNQYDLDVSAADSYGIGSYTLTITDLGASGYQQVVPIVGHLTGAAGSEFRSDLKLYNTTDSPIVGRLLFTPRGQSASAADPAVSFNVSPHAVAFLEDVYLLGFPGGSGAARLAVVADSITGGLVINTSTYTVVSGGGELGLSPSVLSAADFSPSGTKIVGILGKATERTNIFVVTGPSDTTVQWNYRDGNGVAKPAITRTYIHDATHQFGSADLLGFSPGPNSTLEAKIVSGSARLASSPVHNTSNQGRWSDFLPFP